MLKSVSKQYKQTISRNVKRHNYEKIEKLRKLRSRDPKEYWRILNKGTKKADTPVSVDEFYDFFKRLNNPQFSSHDDTPRHSDNAPDNHEINMPITEEEIRQAAKTLKGNKSPGFDQIINEHLIASLHLMLPTYLKLFNLVFDKAVIPESWLIGEILPIFKNKGDIKNPENYRPITLLSCLGKLFTSIINSRLNKYAEKYDIITDCQSGFRKGFSTIDNLFVINSLVELLKAQSKKLFCVFIDFKQAFDSVWRTGLWQKLLMHNINGKCLKLIQSLYDNIKSRVKISGSTSTFFPCRIGVRQGENLSPFLFSIFLNDLECYLTQNGISGLKCDFNDDDVSIYFKLFILLYADDTVIFGETADELQKALNSFKLYCEDWKLTVNVSKTKVLIISRGRPSPKLNFFFNNTKLEIVQEYKYLGIYLSRSGSFHKAKKYIAEQANKALFSLLKKIRSLNLTIDLQVDLFNKMVKPILLYGSELWGHGNCDVIERVQLKFIKHILNLKRSTPTFMIYGELGITPIIVDIKARVISFWSKLVSMQNQPTRLSYQMYLLIFHMHKHGLCKSAYIENVKGILESCGFSGIWETQDVLNTRWLTLAIKQRLKDQYLQEWHSIVEMASSSKNYRLFKDTFERSKYLNLLSNRYCKILMRFRTRNNKLPIEVGRWNSTPLRDRICTLGCNDLGDEYHYILICDYFKTVRQKFVKPYYYTKPNTQKFKQLMDSGNPKELSKLCQFIMIINRTF